MQRDRRIRKSQDFARVSVEGRAWADHRLLMRAALNHSMITRYGFVVRKGIGSAVLRNRLKRCLRAIAREMPEPSVAWDIVLVVRKGARGATSNELARSLKVLLSRSGISRF
jgi:ribonuclease P protein component